MQLSTLQRPRLSVVLVVIAAVQAFGLYLFLKGFLLARQSLLLEGRSRSAWETFPVYDPTPLTSDLPPTVPASPPFERAVIVVIDALRFDFLLKNDSQTNHDKYFLKRLPIIQTLRDHHPDSSLLYQFRADPPTTTMQRVKGIMTGSLPTFIDAGANFASSAVSEDHLLRHVKKKYQQLYFMGDDTWTNLFPEVFDDDKAFSSDSFRMFDLHTVDNRILSKLWPLLESDDASWQIIITHFLGVDHCGHTYGPSHPNMADKLTQMNGVIERILSHIDDKTLLVVMGDHGMSVEGDHGGESTEELMSGLFLYSGRALTSDDRYHRDLCRRIHKKRSQLLGYDERDIADRLKYDAAAYPIVAQVNIVPTLAYLLDIPIPFGNLGAVIPDVVIPPKEKLAERQDYLLHMVQEYRKNALQVREYLHVYSEQTNQHGFSPRDLEELFELFNIAERHVEETVNRGWSPPAGSALDTLEQAIFEYDAFLITTMRYCASIWAQFDVGYMIYGIAMLILTLGVVIIRSAYRQPIWSLSTFTKWTVFLAITIGIVSFTLQQQSSTYIAALDGLEKIDAIGIIVAITALLFTLTTTSHSTEVKTELFFLALLTSLKSATLGSNSFVIWEDRVVRFTSATLCVLWIIRSLSSRKTGESLAATLFPPVGVLCWIRMTGITGHCREEQFPYCDYVHNGHLELGYYPGTICFLALSVFIFIFYLPNFVKKNVTTNRGWIISILHRTVMTVVFARMILDIYEGSTTTITATTGLMAGIEKLLQTSYTTSLLKVYLPHLVYLITITSTLHCIYYMCRYPSQATKQTCTWILLCFWTATLAMLQRPLGTFVLCTAPFIIQSVAKQHGNQNTLMLRLGLLLCIGHHLFYTTYHQATFTSLPWKAAFIGFDDMNYYAGATLVALSTISGYIVSWLSWMMLLANDTQQQQDLDGTYYLMLLLELIPTTLSSVFVCILRRHLMTWKIFAPRFLLQAILGVGSAVFTIICRQLLRD